MCVSLYYTYIRYVTTVTYVSKSKVSRNSLCVYIKKQVIERQSVLNLYSLSDIFHFIFLFLYAVLGKFESRFISKLLLRTDYTQKSLSNIISDTRGLLIPTYKVYKSWFLRICTSSSSINDKQKAFLARMPESI